MARANSALNQRTKEADFLQLDATSAPSGGLTDWLYGQLRAAVLDGRLAAETRLPASRSLAAELGVSRGVVTAAYQRLVDEGQAIGRGRAGTYVVGGGGAHAPAPKASARSTDLFAGAPDVAVFDALRTTPARIDLSPGVPHLAAFPRGAWLRAERTVLNTIEPGMFGYGDPQGTAHLRDAIANWLARFRGIRVHPDHVIVVAGVAQALALIAQSCAARGLTRVAVEDPGSLGARQQLHSWGLQPVPVTLDAEGLQVDRLRRCRARVAMVTPAHQFPTGVVLSGQRRREILAWAHAGGLIVEDDYDAEHRYDRPPVPSLCASQPDRVLYTGSVSKLLAPALRIGWLVSPPQFRDELVALKRAADLGNAVVPQLVLADMMNSGSLERHLRLLRRRHRRNRDAMIAAIGAYLPAAAVHGAAAGLHLTVTFDAVFSDVAVAAAALHRGVKVQPLSWHRHAPGPPGLVLSYAAASPAQIDEGIRELGKAVGSLRQSSSSGRVRNHSMTSFE